MPERDQLDVLLDSALASYADPGPNSGIEGRVLAALAAAREENAAFTTSRRRWLPWAIAIPAVALIILWLAIPKPIHAPVSAPRVAQSHEPAEHIASTAQPSHPSEKSVHRTPASASAMQVPAPTLGARATPLPKLDVFPAPRPLTTEEQALVTAATGGSKAERDALLESQKPVDTPLNIAALNIPPLASPGEGQN